MELFKQGYNCAQSVILSFADILESSGLADEHLLKVIGSGFGGGMGRLREVCGAFSACTMIAGFISPADVPADMAARKANYAIVQEFAQKFKDANGGSIVCRELLGLESGSRQNRRRRLRERPNITAKDLACIQSERQHA